MTATLTERPTTSGARRRARHPHAEIDEPYDIPNADEPAEIPDEPSDLDDFDGASIDDANWDVFVADDDECDPLPDPGDFWVGD